MIKYITIDEYNKLRSRIAVENDPIIFVKNNPLDVPYVKIKIEKLFIEKRFKYARKKIKK